MFKTDTRINKRKCGEGETVSKIYKVCIEASDESTTDDIEALVVAPKIVCIHYVVEVNTNAK